MLAENDSVKAVAAANVEHKYCAAIILIKAKTMARWTKAR
jgi:hypothetical protein